MGDKKQLNTFQYNLFIMHEQTIARKIIEDAKVYGNIKSITIEVGDLAHLPATDWKVKVVKKKAIIVCTCGYSGEPKIISHMHDHSIYECPKCAKALPIILDGHQIILKEVEVYE